MGMVAMCELQSLPMLTSNLAGLEPTDGEQRPTASSSRRVVSDPGLPSCCSSTSCCTKGALSRVCVCVRIEQPGARVAVGGCFWMDGLT